MLSEHAQHSVLPATDMDFVWVLEVSLVHDMYGLFITQIASMNNVNNY